MMTQKVTMMNQKATKMTEKAAMMAQKGALCRSVTRPANQFTLLLGFPALCHLQF